MRQDTTQPTSYWGIWAAEHTQRLATRKRSSSSQAPSSPAGLPIGLAQVTHAVAARRRRHGDGDAGAGPSPTTSIRERTRSSASPALTILGLRSGSLTMSSGDPATERDPGRSWTCAGDRCAARFGLNRDNDGGGTGAMSSPAEVPGACGHQRRTRSLPVPRNRPTRSPDC